MEQEPQRSPGPPASTAALAEALGLSRWTVSRVLNEQPGVKDETRQRVREAIEELGFSPNRMARSLRGVPSQLVGLVFQAMEAPILTLKAARLQKILMQQGYRGIFELAEWDPDKEAAVIRHFLSIQVDGIVLIGSRLPANHPIFAEVRTKGIALVAVDAAEDLPVPRVLLDRSAAMEQLVEHLFHQGHCQFSLFGFETDNLYLKWRNQGFERAANRLGLSFGKDFKRFFHPAYDQQDYNYGVFLANQWMEDESAPKAIIALNDRIAIGAMRALREAGVRIPEEVSLVGFDNLEETAWWRPSLTTMDQNIDALMREASRLLFQSFQSPQEYEPSVRWVSPILVERDSVGPFHQNTKN